MNKETTIKDFVRMCSNQKDCKNCRMFHILLNTEHLAQIDEAQCHKMMLKHPEKFDMEVISYLNEEENKYMDEEQKENAMSIDAMIAHREDAQFIIHTLAGKLPTEEVLYLAHHLDHDVTESDVVSEEVVKNALGDNYWREKK